MAGYATDERVVLECKGCGEFTVLGGPLSVWLSGSTFFECGCGRSLTLADRFMAHEEIEVGTSDHF